MNAEQPAKNLQDGQLDVTQNKVLGIAEFGMPTQVRLEESQQGSGYKTPQWAWLSARGEYDWMDRHGSFVVTD